jgi:hypothetical protein
MANTDYARRTTGSFASVATLVTPITARSDRLVLTGVLSVLGQTPQVGSLILVEDEFMAIASITGTTWGVKRGCLDTVPKSHNGRATVYLVGDRVATDKVEYLGGATITLKLRPRTTSGMVPIEYTPPNQIVFGNRFVRPYPPANLRANGVTWLDGCTLNATTDLTLTWATRNRVAQSDAILGHTDAGVAPEPGTTYTVKLYTDAGTLVRTVSGLTGTSWVYTFDAMVADFGLDPLRGTGIYPAYLTFESVRDGWASWQHYSMRLDLDTDDIADPTVVQLHNAMRAFWEFEENASGNTFADAKGAFPLTVRNASGPMLTSSATAAGLVNRAFYPNMTDNLAAYIPAASNFRFANSSVTIGMWATGIGSSGGSTRFLFGNFGSSGTGYQIYLSTDSSSDSLNFAVTTDGTTAGRVRIISLANLHPSVWTFVACTLDRAANQLVLRTRAVGGAVRKETVAFPGALFTGSGAGSNFAIGDALSNDNTFFSGTRHGLYKVDQAFIADIALTDLQFDYLFNDGAGRRWNDLRPLPDPLYSPASDPVWLGYPRLSGGVSSPLTITGTAAVPPALRFVMSGDGTLRVSRHDDSTVFSDNWIVEKFGEPALTSEQRAATTWLFEANAASSSNTLYPFNSNRQTPHQLDGQIDYLCTGSNVPGTSVTVTLQVGYQTTAYHPAHDPANVLHSYWQFTVTFVTV